MTDTPAETPAETPAATPAEPAADAPPERTGTWPASADTVAFTGDDEANAPDSQ